MKKKEHRSLSPLNIGQKYKGILDKNNQQNQDYMPLQYINSTSKPNNNNNTKLPVLKSLKMNNKASAVNQNNK